MLETWEKAIQDWYEHSHTSNLEYLDLASETKVNTCQLSHNITVVYDKTCLSARVNLKNFKQILERYQNLEKEISKLKVALKNLTTVFTENRPLTKQEVRELIAEIAKQPKLVEEEAQRLTRDLARKLDRVENLLHKIENWTAA